MRNINVTINTRNTFVRESLMAMVNDLTQGEIRARFSRVIMTCQGKTSSFAR